MERNTTETQIALKLTIEGKGRYKVSTGIRFFDHMLELFTRHGGFDLELKCKGDLDVDQHHTVEDVGIALGEAFDQALGDKKGILRAGYFVMPMDETLAVAAVDLSGRAACVVETKVKTRLVGDLQSELVTDFFEGFARGARANVHVKTMYGRSNHHKIEAHLQGVRAGAAGGLLAGQATRRDAAEHEGSACDARYGHRLQGRQSDLGAEGAAAIWRGACRSTDGDPVAGASRRSGLCCRAWGTLRRRARLERPELTTRSREAIARGVPFLGICVGMQWLFEGIDRGAGVSRVLAHCADAARAFPNATEGAACGMELAGSCAANRGCWRELQPRSVCVLHAFVSARR